MRHLCLYAKPPMPGRAKRRLADDLGPELAAELAAALLADALAAARAVPDCQLSVWHPPAATAAELTPFIPSGVPCHEQRGADLGARMADTFRRCLHQPDDRALVVGCDCVTLSAATFQDAFAALAQAPLVFQPTADGGYILVGQAECHPEPFRDVPWGTGEVMIRTRERLRAAALPWRELPPTFDLDTVADLPRARAYLQDHPGGSALAALFARRPHLGRPSPP